MNSLTPSSQKPPVFNKNQLWLIAKATVAYTEKATLDEMMVCYEVLELIEATLPSDEEVVEQIGFINRLQASWEGKT